MTPVRACMRSACACVLKTQRIHAPGQNRGTCDDAEPVRACAQRVECLPTCCSKADPPRWPLHTYPAITLTFTLCAQRVECLPTCCSDADPPRWPPTTSGEYLLSRYAATHAGYDAAAKGGSVTCLEGQPASGPAG